MASASDLISQMMGALNGGNSSAQPWLAAGQIPNLRLDQSSGWIPSAMAQPPSQAVPTNASAPVNILPQVMAMMAQSHGPSQTPQGQTANLGSGLPAGQQISNLSSLLNQYHNAGTGFPSSGAITTAPPSTGNIDFASLLNNPNLAAILSSYGPGGLQSGSSSGLPSQPSGPSQPSPSWGSQFDPNVPHPGMRYDTSSGWIGGGSPPQAASSPQAVPPQPGAQFDPNIPHPGMRYDQSSGWIY